ncbi:MAG: hypothetical protein CBARDCOR_6902, partial [uncultured Caballeronia sp.]
KRKAPTALPGASIRAATLNLSRILNCPMTSMSRCPAAGFALAQRGFAPLLWTTHPRRREPPREQGLRAVGPSLLPRQGSLDPSSAQQSVAGRLVRLGRFFGKGCQGQDRRPQSGAQRRDRVRMPGEALTLDAPGSHVAYRPGGGTRRSHRAAAPAASPARSDAGCNRRGCPSEARSFPTGDRVTTWPGCRRHQCQPMATGRRD